jgi:hypothetical protein
VGAGGEPSAGGASTYPLKANNSPIKHAKKLMGMSRLPKAAPCQYLMGLSGNFRKDGKTFNSLLYGFNTSLSVRDFL